ncbi:MAG: hypothetical protein AB7U20_03885 [Planctomycetaceae bacterium]
MRTMHIEHMVDNGEEIVVVDGHTKYLVDRQRYALRRLTGEPAVLTLAQCQSGRTPDGELEVLERYCSDTGESVVVDSSPDWLRVIRVTLSKGCEPETK